MTKLYCCSARQESLIIGASSPYPVGAGGGRSAHSSCGPSLRREFHAAANVGVEKNRKYVLTLYDVFRVRVCCCVSYGTYR